jgi:hypothetical protein
MNERQRIEYELLVEVCKELDYRLCKLNKAVKEPDIKTTSFNFLWGSKIELLNFKDFITEKLAEYRRTIFKTKKTQENEQIK